MIRGRGAGYAVAVLLILALLVGQTRPAAAVTWAETASLLTASESVLDNLVEEAQSGFIFKNDAHDAAQLRHLHDRLHTMLARKGTSNRVQALPFEKLDQYLAGGMERPDWASVQASLWSSMRIVTAVLQSLQDGGADFVNATGLSTHPDLLAALNRPQPLYRYIADLTEPQTPADLASARIVSNELHRLYDQIIELEGALDSYPSQ